MFLTAGAKLFLINSLSFESSHRVNHVFLKITIHIFE